MVGLPSATRARCSRPHIERPPQFARYKRSRPINKRYGSRWSASLGGAYTMMNDFPNGYPQNPNQPGAEDRTVWNFKASGSYDAAYGIRISPVLRHQSGVNYARTGTLTFPTGVTATGTGIYLEPSNSNREDNIWVFDVRAEKTVNVTDRARFRCSSTLQHPNSHASEPISRATARAIRSHRRAWRPLRQARLPFLVVVLSP